MVKFQRRIDKRREKVPEIAPFDPTEQQLPCLAHSTGLGTNDFVETVTQTALLESQEAIWNYDPKEPGNERGGERDAIAIIRTLAVKIQASSQRVEYFENCQGICGIAPPRKIPLHSKTRWGSAAKMCKRGYELRNPIDMYIDQADRLFGPITTIKKSGKTVKKIEWKAFKLSPAGWARLKDCADILEVRFSDDNPCNKY